MKRIITRLLTLLFLSFYAVAQQVPNGFNYQSIARDAIGLPIVNSQINLRITVRQNNILGTDVWQETQSATTNQFGLINLVIGNGTKSGGLASITGISGIDWASDKFFIIVEVNNGGSYVSLGITQFQSVPYALAADNALKIQGSKVGAIIPTANQFLKFNAISGQWEPGNISGANGGTVVSVGGIGPITVTGTIGLDPQIGILQSTAIQDGYLSSLDWAAFSNKLGTSTGFGGNVIGTYDAITVTGIQNVPVSAIAPTNGQILIYDGIQWVPTTTGASVSVITVTGSGEISVTPGNSPVISISTASGISNGIITVADYISFSNKLSVNSLAGGDLSGPYNNLLINSIGGIPISLASAPAGAVLSFNGTGFVPALLSSVISISSTTPGVSASGTVIDIATADGVTMGLLAPSDYNRFGNKVGLGTTLTGGDVAGSYQDGFTVSGLGTKSLNLSGILPGQVLSFNGTSFVPGTPTSSQLTSVTGINGIIVGGSGTLYSVDGSNLLTVTTVFGGDLNGTYNAITVNRIQSIPFSIAGIANGQYLYFNGTSIVGSNISVATIPTITGINGITLNTNTGYDFTISGQTLATYSGDNLLTTLTGMFPNFTIAGISQAQNATTLTGVNGLSVVGSGFSKTIIGQSFIGANGIVVSSTGNTFTISNTVPGLTLFGDNVNTSVVGANNNYTVLGIGSGSQWVSTTGGIYYPIGVGINTLPLTVPSIAPLTIGTSSTWDIAFVPGVGGSATIHSIQDLILLSDANLTFNTNTVDRLKILSSGEIGIGISNPNEKLTVQGNSSVSGISYASGFTANTLTITGIGSGILTVDGVGNVTTTSLSFTTTQTTLTGTNGLSLTGSGFSKTIIGQSFIGANGIVVSSTGNAFTISNTIPGLSLFGDNVNTSVVGANNNFTVLGIGNSSQWIATTSGIYYPSKVGIGVIDPAYSLHISSSSGPSFRIDDGSFAAFSINTSGSVTALEFSNGLELKTNSFPSVGDNSGGTIAYFTNNGELFLGDQLGPIPTPRFSVGGSSSVTGTSYSKGIYGNTLTLTGIGSGILSVDGLGNVATTSLSFPTTQTTLTGTNGLSVVGSGFSQTIIGQSFVGANGIVVSSTGNTFTISNTTSGLTLFGDNVNTSVVGANNNYTVLGIGTGSQWINTGTDKIYTNSFVGIGSSNPSNPLVVQSNTVSDVAFFESFSALGSTIRIYNGGTDGARIKLESGSTFMLENRVTVVGFNFSGNDYLTFNSINSLVGINPEGGVVNIGRIGLASSLSVTGKTFTNGLSINSLSNGILTVDGLGNVTTTSLSFATTQTTLTGINGLSIAGSGFSQTVIGQSFIGANGILVSSTGNTFTISNTTPGLNLFGDGTSTSVVGSNNNYTVLGIGISNQWINTVGGIYYGNFVGIGMSPDPGSVFSIKSSVGLDPLVFQRNGVSPYRMAAFSEEPNGGSLYLYDGSSNAIPTRITSDNLLPSYFTYALGIGTTTPNEILTVYGNSSVSGIGYASGLKASTLTLTGMGTGVLTIDGFGNVTTTALNLVSSQWTTTTAGNIFYSSGKVGIGNILPTDNLHIFNSTTGSSIKIQSASSANYAQFSLKSDIQEWTTTLHGSSNVSGNQGEYLLYDNTTGNTRFRVLPTTGNVVIGGFGVPANEKLTVEGNATILGVGYANAFSAAKLTLTGIGSGILTVDGFGNVTTTSLSITSSQWVNTTNGIYYNNNIGIGTINPTVAIHISKSAGSILRMDDNLGGGAIAIGNSGTTGGVNLIEYTTGVQFKASSYNNVGLGLGGTDMVIQSGLIGIGTFTPNEQLTVQNNASVAGITYTSGLKSNSLTLIGIGSGILTVDGFGNVTTSSLPVFTQTATTVTGINGISVITGSGYDFTINGAAFVNTTSAGLQDVNGSFQNGFTVTGLAGAPINKAAILPGYALQFDGTSIVGSALINTIVGAGGLTVGTITGGYSIDGSNLSSSTIVGTAGLSVVGAGLSKTISGAGLVVLQQSLASIMGSAATTFNTTSGIAMFKVPVKIPANVKTVSISLNAYGLVGSSSADYVVIIGGNASPVSVNSNDPDNIVALPDLDVSPSQGQIVMLKVYGKVSGAETAAYLQGITITVKD